MLRAPASIDLASKTSPPPPTSATTLTGWGKMCAGVDCSGGVPARATSCGTSNAVAFTYLDAAGCDGSLDANDALAILNAIAGFDTGLLPEGPCTGDFTGNGVVDLQDAILAATAVAGTS